MKTLEKVKTFEEQREDALLQFAKELKQNGFDVYLPIVNHGHTWCHFVKDNNIGYVEYGRFGWNFATVHKPSKQNGTGFSVYRDDCDPTIKKAMYCFCVCPWQNHGKVEKYKSWEDYMSKPVNNIIKKEKL